MLQLRQYQREDKHALDQLLSEHRSVLYPLPTRMGKTEVAVSFCIEKSEAGEPCMFLAHQTQLVNNAVSRFQKYGYAVSRVQANKPAPYQSLYVGSKPTIDRRYKSHQKKQDTLLQNGFFNYIKYIVIDEAHIGIAQTERIQEAFPNAKFICLTATPYTMSGKGIGAICTAICETLTDYEAVRQGWKLETRIYAEAVPPNIKAKTSSTGDYVLSEMAESLRQLGDNVVAKWEKYGEQRTTVIYCPTIDFAHEVAEQFRKEGYPCAAINSDKPGNEPVNEYGIKENVESILSRYRRGDFKLICNVGMLTIGYDLPSIGCIVVYLATKSLNKWRQMNRASGVNCDLSGCNTPEERLNKIAESSKPYAICIDLGCNAPAHGEGHGTFEREVEYSLAKGVEKKAAVLDKVCPECGMVSGGAAKKCNCCGFAFEFNSFGKPKKSPELRKMELELIKEDPSLRLERFMRKSYNDCTPKERDLMATVSDDYIEALATAKEFGSYWIEKMKSRRDAFSLHLELDRINGTA